MTDFVDVLEQQLREAHGRRPRPAPPWRAGIVLVATGAAAAAIVVLVLSLASPSSEHAPAPQTPATTAPAPAPARGVSLAVLNGTTQTGLARTAADELVANGYPEPNVVTNDTTNQSRQRTQIFYEPGHEADAQGVARCLDIAIERVRPMTPGARALADRAEVAVFLGADRGR